MHKSTKTPRVYIASPLFNEVQIADIESAEDEMDKMGIEYFSPRLTSISPIYDKLKNNSNYLNELGSRILKNSVFKENMMNIDSCDIVLVNNVASDGVVDSGTLFEAGYSLGKGKTVAPFDDDKLYGYLNFIKFVYSKIHPGTAVQLYCNEANELCYHTYDSINSLSYTVIAEGPFGKYVGLSKLMAGYLCAKCTEYPIYFIDIPRKSNMMLSCALTVMETRELYNTSIYYEDEILKLSSIYESCRPISMGDVDE